MNFTKNQIIIAGIAGLVAVLGVLVLIGIIPGRRSTGPDTIAANLAMWGVGDNQEAFAAATAEFKTKYKNVTISYRAFPSEASYEAALLDALAAGTGPDIFTLRNDKLFRHLNKIVPAAITIALPELRVRFPQIVEKDFYRAGIGLSAQTGTYALPLSVDTLALFYNRDLLDTAGIASVPATWDEVQSLAPALTRRDAAGAVVQSGIALGGSADEIEAAVDILYLLMLQTGTKMTDEGLTRATFDSAEGLNALRFYLQFGNPTSASYAWNGGAGNARNRFAEGKTAMIIDYASAIPALTARNAFLNYGVAPAPQPKDASVSLTYASYYGYAVSQRSRYPSLAWEFIKAMTTSDMAARGYANTTGKPPALRSLVAAFENDPVKRVFARQILTARSWPQADPDAIHTSFTKLINTAVADPARAANALRTAAEEVTTLIERRTF